MAPSTVAQLAIVVLLILPGTCYLFARERLLGVREAEQDSANRVLFALGVGVVLDTLYLVIAGPQLVALFRGSGKTVLSGVIEHPQSVGLWLLVLVIIVPTLVAAAEARQARKRRATVHEPVPTAWDALFANRGPCFVRARLKNGGWVGGWYGHPLPGIGLPAAWRPVP